MPVSLKKVRGGIIPLAICQSQLKLYLDVLLRFWPFTISLSVEKRPWIEVWSITASRRKGDQTLEVSILGTGTRSRIRSACDAVLNLLRFTLAKP